VHKLIDPKGRTLYIQRGAEATAILAGRQPVPTEQQASGLSRRMLLSLLAIVGLVVLLIVMAILFFLFGEDRTRQVQRPNLTPAQRANAFRL
jgi:lipopolysaccharide/colanic/teichoic acid biosynthesis glycosyltransferase